MKSRSHRLPTSDPHDDWVDGSWTVDCVCGVNFDDGEEMVNCDECGVWVHTRCSRYVKSEKSFACDKCKSKNSRNDSKETEVAQLLVELPTKTLRMDNPYLPSGPPRRPFRLWTERPMEERVHVQGVPGGEPSLFAGLSSVFTPELWKCTGYVPKKFSFQYREFPCWDEEKEVNPKSEDQNENPVNKGAGVLFSLSKENALVSPVAALTGVKRQVDEDRNYRVAPSKDMLKCEGENINVKCPQNGFEKDRTLVRPLVVLPSKHGKEDSGTSKDRAGKKKIRIVDREGDSKKRAPQASIIASTISSDAKQLECYEDRNPKIIKTETQSIKNVELSDILRKHPLSGNQHIVENKVDKSKDNLVSGEHRSKALASDEPRQNISIKISPREEKARHQVTATIESSTKTEDCVASLLENQVPRSDSIKKEVVGVRLNRMSEKRGLFAVSAEFDPRKSDSGTAVAEGKENTNSKNPSVDLCPSSLEPVVEVKTEPVPDNLGGVFNVEGSILGDIKPDSTKLPAQESGVSTVQLSANAKTNSTSVISLQSGDPMVQYIDRNRDASVNCQTDAAVEFPCDPCQPKRQVEGLECSLGVSKSSSELKANSRTTAEPSKLSSAIEIPPAPACQRKPGASSSASSTTVISKPSISDHKPSKSQNDGSSMKRGMAVGSIGIKKGNGSTDTIRGGDSHEIPRKILKERSKSSLGSGSKASYSSVISHASDSNRTLSVLKDPELHSSSRTSSGQNTEVASASGEPASSLQSQSVPHAQNKISSSSLPQRGEKVNLSSTKMNHSAQMHPPATSNSPATLSDEELALLLHQELNSSPRVPRVPRIRHAGSLPQLGSPTAANMLIKRTSSSGGRDHGVVFKRKNKDLATEGSHHEIDVEVKTDRLPPSPDTRRHESACAGNAFSKREVDGSSAKGAVKKSAPSVSTATVSSGPSSSTEANEQKFSSIRSSRRDASDDDTGTISGPTRRTLPGLIAEIMSKGKRMTYEELCNAVLPHWPNLRKHNGERYAYSSHSQAVLDCLRNRQEWAQLVDRGPKTNAGRKRRKLDAEAASLDSEENEYGKDTAAKEVESKSYESRREDFPKGKRKARKRRRLALQGRGIKDVRRLRKAEFLTDDDDDGSCSSSSSSSGEENMFSDDEIQGGGTCRPRSEASTSSDEMGTMS